ncbi:hypothetical protein L204_100942 [Cryptococcus depauperatus]|nr:hypothetical protein L204_01126 [Cryptococcus depauperatus CBS 7855]
MRCYYSTRIARLSRRPLSQSRLFHYSCPIRASEAPTNPFEDPVFKAFADRVKQHQGAIDAMKGLMEVMQRKGWHERKNPSFMQMMEMASDKELKAVASILMTELSKAGIDQSEAMELFRKASSR